MNVWKKYFYHKVIPKCGLNPFGNDELVQNQSYLDLKAMPVVPAKILSFGKGSTSLNYTSIVETRVTTNGKR